jgi:putative N6-adenine-specific DNA methylase
MTLRLFAPCPRGLETLLAHELTELGARSAKPVDGGVAFAGEERTMYRANLESRLASRVLLQVSAGSYRTEEDLYRIARDFDWPAAFESSRTIRVAVSAVGSPLKSIDFATLRVKDAVCDRFRAATGARPDVDTRHPDVRIHVFLDATQAIFYLDTSGDPLFRRGWRTGNIDAPLRENLAAGILALAGWKPGVPLLDPMCGGGTFLLEAAGMSLGMAPGAGRGFGFERLTRYEPHLWREVRAAVAVRNVSPPPAPIHGADHDPRAIRATREALRRAGLDGTVTLQQADILTLTSPAASGVLVANPPYGVRIGEQNALAELYPLLGNRLKQHFAGWRCCFFTADMRLPKLIGLRPARRIPLYNGALECRLYVFDIVAGSMRVRER